VFVYLLSEMTLQGSWDTNKSKIKIAVERCGCNSGSSLIHTSVSTLGVSWLTMLLLSVIVAVVSAVLVEW
jgi:hypothetical protein